MIFIDVSVIIPLYNKARYIGRALESVLAQDFTDFEIIVVDDGSTDGGGDIVRGYTDPRIRLVTQANAGEGHARDRGFREAKGKYLTCLDADDEWTPVFLSTAVRLMEDFPEAGAGGTGYVLCEPGGKQRPAPVSTIPKGTHWRGVFPDFLAACYAYPPFYSSTAIIRKAALEAAKPKISEAKIGADQYLWMQLARVYPIAFDSTIGAYYHIEAAGRVSNVYTPQGELPFITFLRQMLVQGDTGRFSPESIRRYIAKHQLGRAHQILAKHGDRGLARMLLRECRGQVRHSTWILHWLWTYLSF